jgi:hypothetical protein
MVKTAIIEIILVKESNEVPNEQIEQELLSYLNDYLNELPWQHKAKSVKVKQDDAEDKKTPDLKRSKVLNVQPIEINLVENTI